MIKDQFAFLTLCASRIKYFRQFLRQDLKVFYIVIFSILLVVVSNTLMIWLLGKPFDFLVSENYQGLAQLLMLLLLVVSVNQFFQYQSVYRANVLGLSFVGRVRNRLLQMMMSQSHIATEQIAKGDLLTRLSHDVDKAQSLAVETPFFFLSHLLTLLFYCSMLVIIDWQLALLALSLVPVFWLHQKAFANKKSNAAQGFFHSNGILLAKEDEMLGNLKLVNAFNQQTKILDLHKLFFQDAFNWAKKERKLDALFSTSLAMLVYFCALFMIYQGVQRIQAEEMSVSGLVSFLLYMGYMSIPVRGLTQLVFQARSDMMATERVFSLLHEKPNGDNNSLELDEKNHEIKFEQVSLLLDDREIFRNFSLTVPQGKSIAILGPSGVGKSTINNLLLKFIQPTSGSIKIGELDISQVNREKIREFITVVWQQPMLFNDSIRNNLLLAKPDASEAELLQACEESDSLEFIEALADGVDTRVGAGGAELSAGQKQRLHISQALLRNSDILILDEATSALDSQAEEKIIRMLQQKRHGRTTILVAHRYSSIRHADIIIYMNRDGSVTQGTHHELLQNHKDYRQALEWQSGTAGH